MLLKRITNGGSPPREFCDFSEKARLFNAIWITFYTFLEPLEKTELLLVESHSKELNRVASLLTGQVQNKFKRLYFELHFLSDLPKGS